MSDTKDTDNEKSAGSGKTLTLSLKRTVDAGHVRQNFSRGRSKSVVVEKKKRRTITSPGMAATPEAPEPKTAEAPTVAPKQTPAAAISNDGSLSDGEKEARLVALAAARVRDAEDKVRAEEEAVLEAERAKKAEEERIRLEEEAKRKAAEEPEVKPEEVKAAKPEEKAQVKVAKTATAATAAAAPRNRNAGQAPVSPPDPATADREQRKVEPRKRNVNEAKPTAPKRGGQPRRHKGRLTIANALDERQRERSLASLRRKRERDKAKNAGPQAPREKISREITVPEAITIQELGNRMAERAVDIIKYLMKEGEMHKINDVIDADTAELIAEEFGHTIKRVSEADVEEGLVGDIDADEDLEHRPPVVTIMGHVDHGKTSLLDALRKTNVVSGEAGGITQHIGAYQVSAPDGSLVTFIDTPGHAAFTAMRARGAKATDIVVLVVAADDGVMPQTIEAINHAQAAEVPIIVAINKMDKPEADPNRVRTDLLQHEIVVESMSGDVQDVEVSAITGAGLDNLLEAIAMQAEILELRANPNRMAEGVVVEAQLERGRGPVGTILMQRGRLRVGQIAVAGRAWGKVRALINDKGEHIKEAGPSFPVEVLGFNSAPEAGDHFAVVESEARAREIVEYRIKKRRDIMAAGTGSARSLEQMMSQLQEDGKQEFPLLIKGDVQGSVEAITAALDKLGNDEVGARVVHAAAGGITESDVTLSTASNAVIIGFNVRANRQARDAAAAEGIEIRYYSIIYDLVDDVKAAMSGMLAPELREKFLGNAKILEVFNISKVGKIAGCLVTEGKVERGASVRLIRDDVVIHEGKLSTLKRFKDEVKDVQSGQECGMGFENYHDLREGDIIECFHVEEIERSL